MIYVLIWLCCAFLAKGIAVGKGNDPVGGFLLGLILGPLGVIIAWASSGDTAKCPNCAELVRTDAHICKHCGSRLYRK